jgi:two-component system NtrC family sensor kinase
MPEKDGVINAQIKEAIKLTGARWAVWLRRGGQTWEVILSIGLVKTRLSALSKCIRQSDTTAWLSGSLASGRVRSRYAGPSSRDLECQRLYAFPNKPERTVLLVGADALDALGQGFWRILSQGHPLALEAGSDHPVQNEPAAAELSVDLEATYNPEKAVEHVLQFLVSLVPSDSGLIAIRTGDLFHVEATWNCPPEMYGQDLLINGHSILAQLVGSRQGVIQEFGSSIAALGLRWGKEFDAHSRLLLAPIAVGRRVIGLLALANRQAEAYSQADLNRATIHLERMAHVIENAIVFQGLSHYLQQFALLDDLAYAASVGLNIEQVANQVVERLQRAFKTTLVAMMLLSKDGKWLRQYGQPADRVELAEVPVDRSLAGYVVENGQPIRLGDISLAPRYLESVSGVKSALAVPLKNRGQTIGVIILESLSGNAFTLQDERLLVVIASHLAGLLENVRLNQETRERASNLELIHKVLRQVVGITNLNEIAETAARLMASYFSYDLVTVVLADEERGELVNYGSGGSQASRAASGLRLPVSLGITGKVYRSGDSQLVNDVDLADEYVQIPGVLSGSEMCVPLREGEHILGVVNVECSQKNAFSDNDLLILESLAGILTSVISNARRYHELKQTINMLSAARETGLDISSSLDLEALLQRVVHRAKELTNARGGILGLVDPQNKVVRVIVSEHPWPSMERKEIRFGEGVTGKVAATGAPMIVANYATWENRIITGQPIPVQTIICIPLKIQDEIIATLTVADDTPGRAFRDEDIRVLELLAPQIALSIRNARLYQELEERIKAQVQAEKQLLRSARLAAVGEMSAGVAHELNNPLTTVIGFVQLALHELAPEEPLYHDLQLVLREAQRARGVVRRLLDFSRQDEQNRVAININDLISETLALVVHRFHSEGISLETDLAEELPSIGADPDQIKQVILNLVINAAQAMPHGGALTIKTRRENRHGTPGVNFSVRDTGEGITPENMDRIFEPFFTTRPAGMGTGLGLSVSYRIITSHSGLIDVDSRRGEGSCFTVWLPQGDSAEPMIEAG